MSADRKKLIEQYVRVAWILKIRLMSARRQLWDQQTSLIHIENSVLQLRKACEAVVHMSLVAADLDQPPISNKLYKEYDVGKILRRLPNNGLDHFPKYSRLNILEAGEHNSSWELVVANVSTEDLNKITSIHRTSGNLLHENFLYRNLSTLDPVSLSGDLNGFRGDHQWLWNRFWRTAANLSGTIFFVDLGDNTAASQPTIIKQADLLKEDVELNFDADVVADFSERVEWPLDRPRSDA
jgi:hypothetical protein